MNITQINDTPSQFYYLKTTIYLAIPVILAHVIEAAIPFINTVFAGHLGTDTLAAAALVNAIFFAFMGFGWGIITSVGILTAHHLGEKSVDSQNNQSTSGNHMLAGLIICILIGFPIMIVLYWLKPILIFFDQDPIISNLAQIYFNGLLWGVIPDLAKFALIQFMIAHNSVRIPLLANLATVILVITFNHALINGYYGLPALGILGIGVGTTIAYWLSFIALLFYVLIKFRTEFKNIGPIKKISQAMREQSWLGVPVGAMFSIELAFFVALALLMGFFGKESLAAHQIAMQWFWFIILIAFGFAEAITILVSKCYGAKKMYQMKKFINLGIFLSFGVTILISVGYLLFPHLFIRVDLDIYNPENYLTIQLATQFLILCGIFQLIDCMRVVVSGALRGLQDTQYPMWVVAISFWFVALPLSYVFAFVFNLKGTGLWLAVALSAMVNLYLQSRRLISNVNAFIHGEIN